MRKDTRDILALVERADTEVVALATVTRTIGSAYRRPGARMLIGVDSRLAGSVSGGCLERDLVRRASWLIGDGPRRLRIETTADPESDEVQLLGCGGAIEILIEAAVAGDRDGPLALLRWAARASRRAALATVVASDVDRLPIASRAVMTEDGSRAGHSGHALLDVAAGSMNRALRERCSLDETIPVAGGRVEVFVEIIEPVRQVLIAGQHHDVEPLVTMARLLGWEVTVAAAAHARIGTPEHQINPRPQVIATWAAANPDAAVVVMTHSLSLDRDIIGALLESPRPPRYLGVLGPAHRTDAIVAELTRTRGVPPDSRLSSPVGLPLGGEGPEAVALSITAELQTHFEARAQTIAVRTRELGVFSPA